MIVIQIIRNRCVCSSEKKKGLPGHCKGSLNIKPTVRSKICTCIWSDERLHTALLSQDITIQSSELFTFHLGMRTLLQIFIWAGPRIKFELYDNLEWNIIAFWVFLYLLKKLRQKWIMLLHNYITNMLLVPCHLQVRYFDENDRWSSFRFHIMSHHVANDQKFFFPLDVLVFFVRKGGVCHSLFYQPTNNK